MPNFCFLKMKPRRFNLLPFIFLTYCYTSEPGWFKGKSWWNGIGPGICVFVLKRKKTGAKRYSLSLRRWSKLNNIIPRKHEPRTKLELWEIKKRENKNGLRGRIFEFFYPPNTKKLSSNFFFVFDGDYFLNKSGIINCANSPCKVVQLILFAAPL